MSSRNSQRQKTRNENYDKNRTNLYVNNDLNYSGNENYSNANEQTVISRSNDRVFTDLSNARPSSIIGQYSTLDSRYQQYNSDPLRNQQNQFMQQQYNDYYSHQQFYHQPQADYTNQGRSNYLPQYADPSNRTQSVKLSTLTSSIQSSGRTMNHDLMNQAISDQHIARFTQQSSCPNTPNSASTPKRQSENEQYNKSNLNKRPKSTLSRQQLNNNNNIHQYSVPFSHLKRAVANNLPCFIIQYDSNISPKDLPSNVLASDLIHEHLIQQGVRINPFTVAVSTGKFELKLGVNNKEDYSALMLTDKWPTHVSNKRITVVKPKFVPECFTLVIRYVPNTFNVEQVKEEIKRSIKSADHFKQIIYSYERPTRDYRFTVADLREYKGALQLGRMAVDPRYDVIRRYRTDLNKAVNMAIRDGKLHRREIPQQQPQQSTFRYTSNDFPAMNADKIKGNPWNLQNNNNDQHNIMNYLQQMNDDIKKNFKQINDKLNTQQQEMVTNIKNTHLNKIVVQSTLSTISKMLNKVIKPLINLLQDEQEKERVLIALDDHCNDVLKQ
ncbi:unnamed protein product, partial [Didymodactylos carnosus]